MLDPKQRPLDFRELLTQEQEFLRVLIRTIGVPASDVLDVLQDANLYLIENQEKYILETNFRAWAAQVVRYRSLNYFRSKKRRPMVNLSEEALDLIAGEMAIRFEDNNTRLQGLSYCLTKLSDDQRKLLEDVYRHGHSIKNLARLRKCSHAALRKAISRIRQALKICIETNPEI